MSSRRRGIEAQADDPWLQHGLDYGDNRRVPLASVSVLSINQSVSRLQPVLLPCPLAPARLRLIKTGHRSFGTGDAVYGSLSACAPMSRANGDNLKPVHHCDLGTRGSEAGSNRPRTVLMTGIWQ